MKYWVCILVLSLLSTQLFSQEYKKGYGRSNWQTKYSFAIPDGSTEPYFGGLQLLEIEKDFNVGKPISLFVKTNFGYTNSKVSSNIKFVSLGGGFKLYPKYFASLIADREYQPDNDNLYVDFGLQALVNKTDFDYLYSINLNVYTFRFKKNQSLGTQIGYNMLISNDETNKNIVYKDLKYNIAGFFGLSVNYGF